MKTLTNQIIAIVLLLLAGTVNADSSIVVIVNKNNTQSLSPLDIKNIYSDTVTTWDNGKTITLLNLATDTEARKKFSREIFAASTRVVAAEEANRKITNTLKNPSITKRAKLVAKRVSRDENAIGYVPRDVIKDMDDNIRVILTIE